MIIVRTMLSFEELRKMEAAPYGDLVKTVVDVERGIIALDSELHSDLETCLLEDGSNQSALWGINLYPEQEGVDFVEFDSMINVRPSQNNRSRGVESAELREQIIAVVRRRIVR